MGRWYSSTPINLHLFGNPSNRVLYSLISITSSNSAIGSGFSYFSEDETDSHRSELQIPQIFNHGNDLLWAREIKISGFDRKASYQTRKDRERDYICCLYPFNFIWPSLPSTPGRFKYLLDSVFCFPIQVDANPRSIPD